MLPLKATRISQRGVAWRDTLRRGAQYFDKLRPRIGVAFTGEPCPHTLTRQPTRHEDRTPLIAAYGVPTIGQVV